MELNICVMLSMLKSIFVLMEFMFTCIYEHKGIQIYVL